MGREANFQHVTPDVPNTNIPPTSLPSSTPHFLTYPLISSLSNLFIPHFPHGRKDEQCLWVFCERTECLNSLWGISDVQWEICHSYWTRPVRYIAVRFNFSREIPLQHIDHILWDYLTAIVYWAHALWDVPQLIWKCALRYSFSQLYQAFNSAKYCKYVQQ